MKIFEYLKSLVVNNVSKNLEEHVDIPHSKEIDKMSDEPKMTQSKEITEPLLTMAQAAKKNGVTRQAIFFAIKMKRLNAHRENDTWLISESALKEYDKKKYCRSKSRKEGELIFDKSKGFYSISEAAKFLNKNTNHIYYLVRMGKLRSHRQGSAIVIKDTDLYSYADFVSKKSDRNMNMC